MALKFLNKKGWHTGSLRNIENVWKAEQKHEAEQKKLEELRKQIQDERERSEFRLLQEQAGLVPKQERLDFLYESGLAVGKSFSSDGPKAPFDSLSNPTTTDLPSSSSSTKQQQSSVPGALFEDKPQSANDAWRKLHSDPLLLIKQREQEAVARIKNNPVQMAMIRKSVEAKKHMEKTSDGEKHLEKHHIKKSKHKKHSTSKQDSVMEDDASKVKEKRKISNSKSSKCKEYSDSEDELHGRDVGRKRSSNKDLKHRDLSHIALSDTWQKNAQTGRLSNNDDDHREKSHVEDRRVSESSKRSREDRKYHPSSPRKFSDMASGGESRNKHRSNTVKLTEEERAARLKEMQMDAELHEEQRWKRLKQAAEKDAKEATRASLSSGRNFLDDAHKSVYGADKGGSSTIEESVRRRTHYSQRQSEGNAFRR